MQQTIQTHDQWQKVRKLAKEWYARIGWVIPSWVYITGAVISFIVVFIDNTRSTLWIAVFAFCVAKLYARNEQIEGYIDGWQHSQEYITGTDTIEELSDWSVDKKDSKNQSPTSDKSNYRK